MKSKKLSIVIPTLNSELFIENSLKILSETLQGIELEFVIVNDGSIDNTWQKLKEIKQALNEKIILINLEKNQGLKTATLIGLEHATHRFAISYDDDMQFKAEDCLRLYNEIQKNGSLVVTGNYERQKINKWYDSSRGTMIKIFDFFFQAYVSCNYYTSFKIFDLGELRKLNMANVYHMWDIPPTKITSIFVERQGRIVRQSNNSITHSIKLVGPALLKISLSLLLFIFLPISIVLTFVLSISIFSIFVYLLLILVLYLLLKRDKYAVRNLIKEVEVVK